jgi:signal transduction histidine kinase
MRYTPIAVSSFLSTAILLAIALYALTRRRRPVVARIGVILLLGSLWSLCSALEFLRTDLEGKAVLELLHVPCVSAMLVMLLFSVLASSGARRWLKPRRAWLFLVEPLAACILAAAARGTTLFFHDFRLPAAGSLPGLLYARGPLAWAHIGYSYLLIGACVLLVSLRLRGAPARQKWQGILVITGIAIPALVYGLFLLGVAPGPGVNITSIAQLLGGLCVAGALFLLPFGAAVPVAASAIVRTMEDLVLVVDPEGRLVSANPNACAVIGLDSPLGLTLDALPAPWRTALAPWWEAPSAREAVRVDLPGRTRFYHLSVSPLREDTVEKPLGRLLLLHDVTERVEAAEALRRSEEHLRQAQKMEAVGRLAGGIAHDYNNLLMVITGYCDLLEEELPGDSTAKRQVTEIARAARRASALTAQLLAFGGRQKLQPRLIEINSLVRGLEERIRGVLGDGIRCAMSLRADGGFIMADPVQIEQAIMNLAMNAHEAMHGGGELALATARSHVDALRDHPEVAAGEYVTIAVTDTGTGMSDQIVSRVFEPFFTTKEMGRGPGLGLPTTYGIVKQSGGYIYCSSTPGRGTTFLLYFPRVTP